MRTIKKGATSQSIYFDVLDSASTTGGRKTGLAYNTSSLVAYYVRNGDVATAITLATLAAANTAWSSGGFKEVDATNMPGIYRLDVPDAAFATGAASVVIVIKGAAGMVQASCDVQLVDNLASDIYARVGAPVGASISADIASVQADTDNIQTRIPAALVSGRIDASVGAMASGVLTATAIASDAITDAKVASDVTIASVTGSVGSVTGAVGSVTGLTASDVGAIKAKTDNLPADPADASDVAAAITAVQNHGDTYWLTATGFSTSADITGAVNTLEGYGDTNWSTATGFSTLDAAGVRGAVGLASANLDTQIGTLATASALTATDGKVDGVKSVTDSLVMTAGKLWVLDEAGNALPHAADVKTQADQALADAGVTTTVTGRIDVATSTRLAAADYTAPDDTAVLSAIGGLNDISAAEVNAEVDTAISDAALATAASLATTDGKVDAVKTKTDGLTFTVSGQVDANMQSINDTLLTGDGSSGDKFGPA